MLFIFMTFTKAKLIYVLEIGTEFAWGWHLTAMWHSELSGEM